DAQDQQEIVGRERADARADHGRPLVRGPELSGVDPESAVARADGPVQLEDELVLGAYEAARVFGPEVRSFRDRQGLLRKEAAGSEQHTRPGHVRPADEDIEIAALPEKQIAVERAGERRSLV